MPAKAGQTALSGSQIKPPALPEVNDSFKDEFDLLYEESADDPKMLTLAMHCQMAFPATGKIYDEAIKYAKSFSDVWFAKRIEIVNWVKEHCL